MLASATAALTGWPAKVMPWRKLDAGEERLDDPVAHRQRAQRRVPAGQALGHGDHVRHVVVALGAEEVPEATPGADHLVGDEQDAVAVADLADPLEVARRRGEAAAGVLHRLQEHGGDRRRVLGQDGLLDGVGGPAAEGVHVVLEVRGPVEVGVRDLEGARHQRLERRADLGHAGDRQGAHGGAVVGDVPADHLVALGLADELEVLAGQLPRRLDRLGAAGGEEDRG